MAELGTSIAQAGARREEVPRSGRKHLWAKRFGWALAILLTPLVLLSLFLSSPIGKRVVADQIAKAAPASGLRFEVGRIEGDLYGQAILHDVVLKDPKGTFLTIPEVELDWRPLSWLCSGLDIRKLIARRGTLTRLPKLLPRDPDAPFLPDFDIRIDQFEIDNLMVAKGVAGRAPQRINFLSKVDISEGSVLIDAEGALGREDKIDLLLNVQPDRDQFDLALDYHAAADGPIAALAGLNAAYDARIQGEGTWAKWLGHARVTRQVEKDGDQERLAALKVTSNAGTYGLLGQVYPNLGGGKLPDRALGRKLSLAVSGTLENSVFDGTVAAISSALDVRAQGAVDLAGNSADNVKVQALLRQPGLFGPAALFRDARLTASVDGGFRDLSVVHTVKVRAVDVLEQVTVEDITQTATARFDGVTWSTPLNINAARVVTGSGFVDPRLVGGTLRGNLIFANKKLVTDQARLAFPGLNAQLALRGDVVQNVYALAGPVEARDITLENVGMLNANSKILVKFGKSVAWSVRANVSGVVNDVTNTSVANIAGERIRFNGSLGLGKASPIVFRDVVIESERLNARLDSRIAGGSTSLAGSGQHVTYGAFDFDANISGAGQRAVLVLADPFPAAGLSDVRVAIAPSDNGFALDVAGGSSLGNFEGQLGLVLPANAPTYVDINALQVYRTDVTGRLIFAKSGLAGDLSLSGGGLNGTASIAPGAGEGQAFNVAVTANEARFGGELAIVLDNADIKASGTIGGTRSTVNADITGNGLQYGALKIANFAAQAAIVNGRGELNASIAGRRADRFSLKLAGDFEPERISLVALGQYGGRDITMPRRAVLTRLADGGYRLAPAQIGYADGYTIVEGTLGGPQTAIEARLARMPLRLFDLAGAELGLGGRLSGVLRWNQLGSSAPTGNARVRIDDFTRSGLILSSRPIDVFAVADLQPDRLVAGARLREDSGELGRIDARITGLSRAGDLTTRLRRGRLNADLRYGGAAEALWRLLSVEAFDLTGPLSITANATGTIAKPRITGDIESNNLRLQSAVSGTDIENVTAQGRFNGSRLEIARFAGVTRGGGTVTGSGMVDLARIGGGRGPRIDIRAAVKDARLLNARGLDATLTGPMRFVSNGIGGTIAGRVEVDRASWVLGRAAEDVALPKIPTREINLPRNFGSARSIGVKRPWRYLVDARTRNRVAVDGLGLDSEWGVDIRVRGTTEDPRIGGEATLVRGNYTFAGTRFELTRGRIAFDDTVPIDPLLDIEARASANSTDVTIDITGNAQKPEVAFSSIPALPQEEILAQLLFGGSVTTLSATDAIQLGSALASLQGKGGGLDPIGTLRRSIGLDQLRIVSADPTLGRGTGIALGKNLGRRVYIELITDGQGYSATQVEYRITRWLALLGTVTTVGRDSVLAEISRDY